MSLFLDESNKDLDAMLNIIAIVGFILTVIAMSPLFPRAKIDLEFFLERANKEFIQPGVLVAAKVSNSGFFKLRGKLFVEVRNWENTYFEVVGYPEFCIKLETNLNKEINLRGSEVALLRVCKAFNEPAQIVIDRNRRGGRGVKAGSETKTFDVIFRPGLRIKGKVRLIPFVKFRTEFNFISDIAVPASSKILQSGINSKWIQAQNEESRSFLTQIILNGESDSERNAREFKKIVLDSELTRNKEIAEKLFNAGASSKEVQAALAEAGIKSEVSMVFENREIFTIHGQHDTVQLPLILPIEGE